MATTRKILIERIKRAIEGGTSSLRGRVGDREIGFQINDALAPLLKLQVFESFKGDEADSIPDGAMIATYENLPVDRRDDGRCSVALPAQPMVIPGGLGVFAVYPSGYPERAFIPVQTGMEYILKRHKLLSPLGRKTYTMDSGRVTIHDDIVGAGITKVDMKLCVVDIFTLDEHAPLPIPPEMAEEVFIKVLKIFGFENPADRAETKAPSPQKADVKA